MRRQIFILFLAFSLLLSACGSEGGAASSSSASSPPAEDHSVGGSPAPEEFAAPLTLAAYPTASFHPVLSGNKANLTLAPLLYEGLFAVDSQFQAVPLLCEGYTVSEDRLTWTFTLRSGVTFSDGTPLTGETAAQALQTALDPASRYAGRLSGVQRNAVGGGDVLADHTERIADGREKTSMVQLVPGGGVDVLPMENPAHQRFPGDDLLFGRA